jgi:hypothetical protein
MCQTIVNGALDPRCPGQTREQLKFRQPDDLLHSLKTVNDLLHFVPTVKGLLHFELVVGLRTQFCTLLEV